MQAHAARLPDCMLQAMPRPTALRGPDACGLPPARPSTVSMVCASSTSVSMTWPTGRTSPRAIALRFLISAGVSPSSRQLVHLRLVAEHHLHAAEAAEGRRGGIVGVGAPGAQPDVAHLVRAAGVDG
jgi:hypothetical protein